MSEAQRVEWERAESQLQQLIHDSVIDWGKYQHGKIAPFSWEKPVIAAGDLVRENVPRTRPIRLYEHALTSVGSETPPIAQFWCDHPMFFDFTLIFVSNVIVQAARRLRPSIHMPGPLRLDQSDDDETDDEYELSETQHGLAISMAKASLKTIFGSTQRRDSDSRVQSQERVCAYPKCEGHLSFTNATVMAKQVECFNALGKLCAARYCSATHRSWNKKAHAAVCLALAARNRNRSRSSEEEEVQASRHSAEEQSVRCFTLYISVRYRSLCLLFDISLPSV